MKRIAVAAIAAVLAAAAWLNMPVRAQAAPRTASSVRTAARMEKMNYLSGKYDGEVKDKKPHGQGTLVWENGTYTGSFINGYPNGQGKLTYQNAEGTQTKSGSWCFGKCSVPMCTDEASINALYCGLLMNNRPWGYGTVQFPYGGTFFGFFLDGVPSGNGVYTRADGTKIEGTFTWMDGKATVLEKARDGSATEFGGTAITYTGLMSNQKFSGFGVLDFGIAGAFFGEFVDGTVSGSGIYYYKQSGSAPVTGTDWSLVSRAPKSGYRWYSGLLLGDKEQGFGLLCQDTSYYIGELRNTMKSGYGEVWHWANAGDPNGTLGKQSTGFYSNNYFISTVVLSASNLTPAVPNADNLYDPYYTPGYGYDGGGNSTWGGSSGGHTDPVPPAVHEREEVVCIRCYGGGTVSCTSCHGGYVNGSTCSTCGGGGSITCPTCFGSGTMWR